MQSLKVGWLLCLALVGGTALAVGASLPQRDLTVELRQIEEGRDGGNTYSAGGIDTTQWEPQMVQVRNGEKAVLRMNDAIPMQWTQSAAIQSNAATTGNALATPQGGTQAGQANAGAAISNALTWFDAGQSMTVQPRWTGGSHPATLEIEVQRASVDARQGAELPKQTRHSLTTTVTVPLAEWVTVAATGHAPRAGTYSSEAGLQRRRLLQVRVMAP